MTYAFGYSETERERLLAQSLRFAPITERFLRDAGVRAGQRVLDVGAGFGDVAIAVARLVGPGGVVIGVERSAESIAFAEQRIAAYGYANVRFVCAELEAFQTVDSFDAVVGRLVLEFIPDPVAALTALRPLLRSGGIAAFQEPWWETVAGFVLRLPLWSRCYALAGEGLRRRGANPDLGATLHCILESAGFERAVTRFDVILNDSAELVRWPWEVLQAMLGDADDALLDLTDLGDLSTLSVRLENEVRAAGCVVPSVPLAGVWARNR
ncbi:MAG: methyltransferase domain-containing protein [Candidatus Eremiobacteraeota bacterium]|nr:methyltransferase domain-containing protein [Candidatus Eremiobacteraeota bacterium]